MRRHYTIAIALLFVLAMLAVPTAGVLAADNGAHEQAELYINQPDYVDTEVQQHTENDTVVYEATGETVQIVPTNVDRDNITGYGMDTDAGTFTKDGELGVWTLNPQGESGTFELYWYVDETVEQGNETRLETVRYEATVRVDGTEGVYLSQDEHEEQQAMVALGERADGVVADLQSRWLPFFDASGEPGEVIDRMGNLAATIGNPANMFSEGYLGFHTFIFLSVGGTLAALQYLGFFAWAIRKLRREKHEFEVTEQLEGDVATRQLEVEEQERLNKLANMDWFDIFEDDHVARAFRDHMGESVLDGWIRLNSIILPRNIIRDRVQAMGHAGYVGVGTFDHPLESDDEDAPKPTLEGVELVLEDDVDDDLGEYRAVIDLTDTSKEDPTNLETVVDVLDWTGEELVAFDFDDARLNPRELETSIETLDLERLVDRLEVEMGHFEDEEQYGEYLQEFLESVREHPFTDDNGTPDGMRYTLNNFLQAAQLVGDRYGFPLTEYQVDAFSAAVDSYDRSARAAAYSDEVSSGAV